MDDYVAHDPRLPLLLSNTAFQADFYHPVSGLVGYVSHLLQGGYHTDTMFADYIDLYLLDFYVAQVKNGGNSQFIKNSGVHLSFNLERAERGAYMIGLPELGELVQACAQFCAQNPTQAAAQDGFANRAPDLDPLDKALYALKFTPQERDAYIAAQRSDISAMLRAKFDLPDAAPVAQSVTQEVIRLSREFTLEAAITQALDGARDQMQAKIATRTGGFAQDVKEARIDQELEALARGVTRILATGEVDGNTAQLESLIRSGLEHNVEADVSKYWFAAFVWIAGHPNLTLVRSEDLEGAIEDILARSPFAIKEKAKRSLDRLREALPDDVQFALARALGQLGQGDGTGPFFKYKDRKADLGGAWVEAHIAELTDRRMFLCQSATEVVLFEPRASKTFELRSRALSIARMLGVINGRRYLQMFTKLRKTVPGAERARAPIIPGQRNILTTLAVPEAMLMWNDGAADSTEFANCVIDALDITQPSITLRYRATDGAVIHVRATPDHVEIEDSATGRKARYKQAVLTA